jgi:AcrR family transcriptional regulator
VGAIRARRKAERPSEILEAAFEEFVLHGYAAARLEDVAARAGVTKGTIYVYFQNKEELFGSLARERGKELLERVAPFFTDRGEPTAETLREDLMLLYRGCADDRRSRELLRLLIAEAMRFPELVDEHFQSFIKPIMETIRVRLRRGTAAGAFRPGPVADFPELLMGPALSFHIWKLLFAEREPLDAEKHFAAALDLVLNGLLPRGDEAVTDGTSSRS